MYLLIYDSSQHLELCQTLQAQRTQDVFYSSALKKNIRRWARIYVRLIARSLSLSPSLVWAQPSGPLRLIVGQERNNCMAGWQAIYPCRLMPFPSGVLPTNRNMPWNSSWKIHLIPARLFFRPLRILSHQYESESERGFSLLYPWPWELAAWWIPGITSEWCLPFISISSSLFSCLCLHLSSSAGCSEPCAERRERHLWNCPWKCAVLGVTHLQMKWLYYRRPAVSAVNQMSQWTDIHVVTRHISMSELHWRTFHLKSTLSNCAFTCQ